MQKEIRTVVENISSIRSSKKIMQSITDLVAKSWLNAPAVVEASFHDVSRIMLGYYGDQLVGFQSWGAKKYDNNKEFAASYLGLATIDLEAQGKGLGKIIVGGGSKQAFHELKVLYPELPCYLWTATVSPVSYLGLRKIFPQHFNPRPDGSYAPEFVDYLPCLKAELQASDSNESEFPFLLRSLSQERYTDIVRSNLRNILKESPIPIFSKYNISEENGDQLILIFDHLASN